MARGTARGAGIAWSKVSTARGVDAVAIDLPGHGASTEPLGDLHGDAAAVSGVLDALDGPVVLCGHSYGGAVISEGAVGHPNVRHLVFLAALMLDVGESCSESVTPPETGTPGRESELGAAMRFSDDGTTVSIDPVAGRTIFFADCTDVDIDWAIARLGPQPAITLQQPVPAAAWRDRAVDLCRVYRRPGDPDVDATCIRGARHELGRVAHEPLAVPLAAGSRGGAARRSSLRDDATTNAATARSGMPTPTTTRRRTATCSRGIRRRGACGGYRSTSSMCSVTPSGLDVLEYGCGAAQWSIALAQDGARAVGLDQSRAQLRHADVLNRAHGTDVALVCASGEAVPFADRVVRRRVLRPRRDVVLRSVPRRPRGGAPPPIRRSLRVRALHAVGLHHLEPQARLHEPPASERVLRDARRRLRRGHGRLPSSVRRVDPSVPRARPRGRRPRRAAGSEARHEHLRMGSSVGAPMAGRADLEAFQGVSERASAARPALREGAVDEVPRDDSIGALVPDAERRVLLAFRDEERAPVELPCERSGGRERRRRVVGGPDHEERRRAGRVERAAGP